MAVSFVCRSAALRSSGSAGRRGALDWARHSSTTARPTSSSSDQQDPWNAIVEWRQDGRDPELRPGPLSGWRTTVKMNICTKDMRTTCASKMLQDFTAGYDATAVAKLREAGADIIGKTNCDEFGMGSANLHSIYGPVINPASPPDSPPRVAGGSSGGAAAAVRGGLCRIAIGTDTGGSIRLPASWCGVHGFKPSYGMVSRWGLVPYAESLDTVGVIANGVDDVAAAFDVMDGPDEQDPSCASSCIRERAEEATSSSCASKDGFDRDPTKIVVGIPKQYFPREVTEEVRSVIEAAASSLEALGMTVKWIDLPNTSKGLSAYYVLALAEASSNLARYDGAHFGFQADAVDENGRELSEVERKQLTRSLGFGEEVKKRILLGTHALTADAYDNYFLKAQQVREDIKADFRRTLRSPDARIEGQAGAVDGVDLILHPAAVRTAPTLQSFSNDEAADSLTEYVQDVLTTPSSLAGLPSLSIPFGTGADGMPIGITLTTQWGGDRNLWPVARALSDRATVHR